MTTTNEVWEITRRCGHIEKIKVGKYIKEQLRVYTKESIIKWSEQSECDECYLRRVK